MQTEQSPTPMNEEIVEEVGSATNLDHHHQHHAAQQQQQDLEGEQQVHHHQVQQHQYEHGVVDMETLQSIAAQSAPLFATSNGGGGMTDSSGAEDAQNSPASNGGHHHLQHSGDKRSTSPDGLSRTRPAPEDSGEEGGEGGEERDKKRQRRLLQNRQSAALSRQRKKEYLGGLERKNNELDAENKVLKQTVYANDTRIRELESRLGFFIKQNEDLKNLLRTSDKVDEMNRLLAQAYSSLALQTAGINVPGLLGLGFHVQPQETPQHLSAPSPSSAAAGVIGHIQQQPAVVSPPPQPVSTHAPAVQEQEQPQQEQQQNLAPLSSLLTPESDVADLTDAPAPDPASEAADARERCRRAHDLATPAIAPEADVAQGQ